MAHLPSQVSLYEHNHFLLIGHLEKLIDATELRNFCLVYVIGKYVLINLKTPAILLRIRDKNVTEYIYEWETWAILFN